MLDLLEQWALTGDRRYRSEARSDQGPRYVRQRADALEVLLQCIGAIAVCRQSVA